jgi:hypothetical protein
MGTDANDFTDQYNTPLTPQQERQFRTAYPDAKDLYDYDLRGAWLSGAAKANNGHLPDTFKKPNHPTFSAESQYSGRDGYAGGQWEGDDKAGWTYTASPTNLQFHPVDQLQDYFQRVEPNSHLLVAPVSPKVRQ